ncbi:MAG: hypothetical protein IT310_03215 [Anaerolineales bacterium]|nr:hypothetical protein [Anaerolineales bacterium]
MIGKLKKKTGLLRMSMKIALFLFALIFVALIVWLYVLPRYLERKISIHWNVQDGQQLTMTGYTVSVFPTYWLAYGMVINAEIYNTSNATLELIEVNSSITGCDGKSTAVSVYNPSKVEGSYSVYYDKLPRKMGQIIPPGQSRPLRLWSGLLIHEDGISLNTYQDDNGNKKYRPTIKYFWNALGWPVLQWCKAEITFVVREAEQNVVDWYQYWENVPALETHQTKTYLPLPMATWRFGAKLDFDAAPIFDQLVEKYGNKGVPNPDGPGRIILKSDGEKIQIHSFHPKLQLILTYYDKKGGFLGFQVSGPFDRQQYEQSLANNGGYFAVGVDGLELPYGAKIETVKAYLELTPDD